MRFSLLLLLVGCVDVAYVDEEDSKCDRGYEFVWTELDGGTCGSMGEVIDTMNQCPATLDSACLESNDVKCGDDRWKWHRDKDSKIEHVGGPSCQSDYTLKRR